MEKLSDYEIEKLELKARSLCNSGKYKMAYNFARNLHLKYPKILYFSYLEAVLSAEDSVGYSKQEIEIRYKNATKKLKKLIYKIRLFPENKRFGLRNEYYWFSKQPYKQYRLGLNGVKKGYKRSYYSIGVGSVMMSLKYSKQGNVKKSLKWANISQKAWEKYFKVVPNWYNSYLFYAMSLGIQGRELEMEKALQKAAKISKKNINDREFIMVRNEVKKLFL